MKLVLSLFSGIGMLDSGFVKNGFCIVQAPEQILNGDVRDFKGIENKFDGVIGGSPCQDFSGLNRNPKNESYEMLSEFCRVVKECQPDWFLHENVVRCPNFEIEGYQIQRFNLSPSDIGFNQSRNRKFQFGSKKGFLLELPEKVSSKKKFDKCVVASEGTKKNRRTFLDVCKLQGFEVEPNLDFFNQTGKYKAVGNGVHLGVSFVISRLILETVNSQTPKTFENTKVCLCGCGRTPPNNQKSFSANCRKRLQKMREVAAVNQLSKITINNSQCEFPVINK